MSVPNLLVCGHSSSGVENNRASGSHPNGAETGFRGEVKNWLKENHPEFI